MSGDIRLMEVNYSRIQLGYLPPVCNGFKFGRRGAEPTPVIIGARETEGHIQSTFELPPDEMAGLHILRQLAEPLSQWAMIPAVIKDGIINTTGNMIPTSIKMAAYKIGEKYGNQIVEQYGAGLFLSNLRRDDEWVEGISGASLGRNGVNVAPWFQFGIKPDKVYLISLFKKDGSERTSEELAETMIRLTGKNLS